jgi:threonine dehydratase
VAGIKKYVQKHNLTGSKKRFVAYVSGANMNFDRLRFVTERAELGEKREALLAVVIPEQPGSFLRLHSRLYPRAITEFSYRYNPSKLKRAYIICSFLLRAGASPGGSNSSLSIQELRRQELQQIMEELQADGMEARDLSDDELAKSHARYLVGGRAKVDNERLVRFEFPERPGALKKFLMGLQSDWNVSLFHYRNQGGGASRLCSFVDAG